MDPWAGVSDGDHRPAPHKSRLVVWVAVAVSAIAVAALGAAAIWPPDGNAMTGPVPTGPGASAFSLIDPSPATATATATGEPVVSGLASTPSSTQASATRPGRPTAGSSRTLSEPPSPSPSPSPPVNLAVGGTAIASSTQLGYPASQAVDGSTVTRWASDWSDSQTITVDLGSTSTVGRTILRWEVAYATAYNIDVSTDGVTWLTVWSTLAGDGDIDNNAFPATTARYVRMTGVKRATPYGYSLWEFEVYQR